MCPTVGVPNNAPLLCSIFQPSWDKILHSTDAIAASHHLFAQRVEKDVEQDLRQFQSRKEFQNMTTMSANLSAIAKELEDAKEKADKLTRKGGKASALKVDQATARLESATGQWESQAPFILETLQALDEQRCNHLRDVLTQLQTHEVDQADRLRATANDALTTILEADTSKEVENFANRATGGRVKIERRTGSGSIDRTPTATRQSSVGNVQPPSTADSSLAPPQTATSFNDDDRSDHSTPGAEKTGACWPCRVPMHQNVTDKERRKQATEPDRDNAWSTKAERPWRLWSTFPGQECWPFQSSIQQPRPPVATHLCEQPCYLDW